MLSDYDAPSSYDSEPAQHYPDTRSASEAIRAVLMSDDCIGLDVISTDRFEPGGGEVGTIREFHRDNGEIGDRWLVRWRDVAGRGSWVYDLYEIELVEGQI